MSAVRFAPFVAVLGLFAGCSSQKVAEIPAEFTILQDVNDLLHSAAGALGKSPARLSDLERYESMYPRGYHAVKSGDVVVLWGAPLKGEGETGKDEAVVAYEKNAPTNGGYVLFSAGTVKKMTAADFGAAPKAGKK